MRKMVKVGETKEELLTFIVNYFRVKYQESGSDDFLSSEAAGYILAMYKLSRYLGMTMKDWERISKDADPKVYIESLKLKEILKGVDIGDNEDCENF